MGLQNYATVRLGTFPERMVFFFSSSCHRHYSRTLYTLLSVIFIDIVANKYFFEFFPKWRKNRPFSMPTKWGGSSKRHLSSPSPEPWKLHIHSSDTFFWTGARRTVRCDHLPHKGYKARKPVRAEAKVLSEKCCLQCWIATNKATRVQIGQWYFSTELAEDPAGVEGPWTRFALERQMISLCAFRGRGRMKRTDQSAEVFSVFWWSRKTSKK